jgi:Zn-dependent protease with chaperone function
MRLRVLSCVLGALVAACTPTAKTPIYARSDVAREVTVQRTLARGGAGPAPEAAPIPATSPSLGFSGTSTEIGAAIRFPPAPSYNSKIERLDYVATRISVAAAPFCGSRFTVATIEGRAVSRCNYPWRLVNKQGVNAFADGKAIYVHLQLLDVASTDDELALVIAHELGHNVMKHVQKKAGNMVLGTLLGALVSAATKVDVTRSAQSIGGQIFSQEFEAEADYVGTYFAALAGYDYRNAAAVMRKMGAINPAMISHGSSHPPTARRFVAIQAAADEIAAKLARREPLVPNGVSEVRPPVVPVMVTR